MKKKKKNIKRLKKNSMNNIGYCFFCGKKKGEEISQENALINDFEFPINFANDALKIAKIAKIKGNLMDENDRNINLCFHCFAGLIISFAISLKEMHLHTVSDDNGKVSYYNSVG